MIIMMTKTKKMTINQSSLRKRRIFLHNSLVSSRAYVCSFHHHQKTTPQARAKSECWLVVRKLHSWGHSVGSLLWGWTEKKNQFIIIINYYYWSKFAEEWRNESTRRIIQKEKGKRKEKEKEKSRSVCRRWSTSLQPRTELLLGRAGNTSLGRAVPLTHCRL